MEGYETPEPVMHSLIKDAVISGWYGGRSLTQMESQMNVRIEFYPGWGNLDNLHQSIVSRKFDIWVPKKKEEVHASD